jgi:hypothetical protein
MLASLDVLGRLKWPSLLAVTALPIASWFFYWRDWDCGLGAALYGPETVAGVALVLAHHADAQPLRDARVQWFVRSCQVCEPRLQRARLAYADCAQPPLRWTEAHGSAGRAAVVLSRPAATDACLWIDAEVGDGRRQQRAWPLRGAAP